jgi:hypothetical protein
MVPSLSAAAKPASPANAALLYYQARLKHDGLAVTEDLSRRLALVVQQGHDPDEQVRRFVSQPDCQEVIFLLGHAGEMPKCEWGFVFSGQWGPDRFVSTAWPALSHLLSVQARIEAAEGQYRPALERALGLRRFARHVGDDTYGMWVTSMGVDAEAFSVIRYVLGKMPPDADVLTWLKEQLQRVQGPSWEPRRILQKWQDTSLWEWQAYSGHHACWRQTLPRVVEDAALLRELQSLTQAEVLERMRQESAPFLKSYLEIIEQDLAYQGKYAQVRQLIDRARDEDGPVSLYVVPPPDMLDPFYNFHVRATATSNAVKAAIEIHLVRAKTGQLPATLPEGVPKDPYSGADFAYEVTGGGFVLRCRVPTIDCGQSGKIRQFEFQVTKGASPS